MIILCTKAICRESNEIMVIKDIDNLHNDKSQMNC